MEQPYPTGYTGHVTKVRHVVGQTNGKMVREAINTLTPSTELAAVKPVNTPTDWNSVADKDRLVSTQQISYKAPDREMELTFERSANAVSTRRPTDMHSRFASSSQLSYLPPPSRSYATPGWSERPTSNIGQPDTYKHIKQAHVHQVVSIIIIILIIYTSHVYQYTIIHINQNISFDLNVFYFTPNCGCPSAQTFGRQYHVLII